MKDRRCKQAFEADVPDDMADREQDKDDDIENKYGDTQPLKPACVVG